MKSWTMACNWLVAAAILLQITKEAGECYVLVCYHGATRSMDMMEPVYDF